MLSVSINIKIIALIAMMLYLGSLLTAKLFLLELQAPSTQAQIQATSASATQLPTALHQTSPNWIYLAGIAIMLILTSIIAIKFIKQQKYFRYFLGFYYAISLVLCTFFLVSLYTASLSLFNGLLIATLVICGVLYLYFKKREEFFNFFGVILATALPVLMAFNISFWTIVLLLVLLCIYDFVAVFITKHMIQLAKMSLGEGSPLPALFVFGNYKDATVALNTPACNQCGYFFEKPINNIYTCPNCKREVQYMEDKSIKVLKEGDPRAPKKMKETYMLGLGDIILPAIFPIVLMMKIGMDRALYAIIGATIGVALNLYIVRQKHIVMPALPLITLCMFAFSAI